MPDCARSSQSREVRGYLQGSLLASEYQQERPDLSMEDVVFVVDDGDPVAEEICSENVRYPIQSCKLKKELFRLSSTFIIVDFIGNKRRCCSWLQIT